MAIGEKYLDELTSRLDIVDVVSRYVPLTKRGGRYWGNCPFHSEKTPSFSVSDDMQMFHCFGCKAGGGLIGFIQKIEGLSFPDAVEFLARMAGMDPPADDRQDVGERRRRERVLALNREAARFFYDALLEPQGAEARAYLEKRAILPATVRRFGMGYAAGGWSGLIDAMKAKGYDKTDLLDAGLAVKSDKGSVYDRFRARLMFPIIDLAGNVVAFGGRVLDGSTPKYLNSPETVAYHKARHLFALNIAKKSPSRRYILAEGYMDVVALHQAGFDTAVASLGTALTSEQVDLIKKRADEVIVAYDGDEAGQAAVARALEMFRKREVRASVLVLPGAKDPDEFIRKNGAEAFSSLLNKSEASADYKLSKLFAGRNMENDEEKIAFVKEAAAMLASLGNPVEIEVYAKKCADMAGIRPESVLAEVARLAKGAKKRDDAKRKKAELSPAAAIQPPIRGEKYENVALARAIEGIIALLYKNPELIADVYGRIKKEWLSENTLLRIYEVITERLLEKKSINPDLLAPFLEPNAITIYTAILAGKSGEGDPARLLDDYASVMQREALAREAEQGGAERLMALVQIKKGDKRYGL